MVQSHESLVTIKKLPSGFQKKPLFVVVGKGVAKLASARNLIKRRIRAIMRHEMHEKENDFTVIARPASAKATFAELKNAIIKGVRGKK